MAAPYQYASGARYPKPQYPDAGECQYCAVVVTWQPDLLKLAALLEALCSQHCPVVVVDNGSANSARLQILVESLQPGACFIGWPDNRGLAAGLNQGIRWAQHRGCQGAFLFDQDSAIDHGFCQGMLQAWRQAHQLSGQVAAIGPRLQDPQSGRRTPFRRFRCLQRSDVPAAKDLYHTDFLITSGTLLCLEACARIGPMREDYFIDNIDLEWCFRAVAAGYVLYGTDLAVLQHRIGEISGNPLVRRGVVVHHSPLRSYYATRNRLHLRRQPYAPLDWKLRDALRLVVKTAWLLLFCPPRMAYLKQTLRGIRDAGGMR